LHLIRGRRFSVKYFLITNKGEISTFHNYSEALLAQRNKKNWDGIDTDLGDTEDGFVSRYFGQFLKQIAKKTGLTIEDANEGLLYDYDEKRQKIFIKEEMGPHGYMVWKDLVKSFFITRNGYKIYAEEIDTANEEGVFAQLIVEVADPSECIDKPEILVKDLNFAFEELNQKIVLPGKDAA